MTGPLLKIERAKKHISDLSSLIDSFNSRDPYRLVSDRASTSADDCGMIFNVREELPEEVPLFIGDAIHNLRASLDIAVRNLSSDLVPEYCVT